MSREILFVSLGGMMNGFGKAWRWQRKASYFVAVAVCLLFAFGCGSTKSRTATEQLLMSDAVDRAVGQLDFRDLASQKVFFDTKYIVNTKDPMFIGNQKGLGFINAEYVTSSLRQQMVAADLRLQDKIEEADYVVEARLGAVGVDNNEVVYGLPASNGLSSAAAVMPNVPQVPSIPEISVARKVVQVGAAKIGVFAYDRRTREPIWQAGISQASSDSRDTWVLGIGPFQRGTIYTGTQFAGTKLKVPGIGSSNDNETEELAESIDDPMVRYANEFHFNRPHQEHVDPDVKPASATSPVTATPTTSPPSASPTTQTGSVPPKAIVPPADAKPISK